MDDLFLCQEMKSHLCTRFIRRATDPSYLWVSSDHPPNTTSNHPPDTSSDNPPDTTSDNPPDTNSDRPPEMEKFTSRNISPIASDKSSADEIDEIGNDSFELLPVSQETPPRHLRLLLQASDVESETGEITTSNSSSSSATPTVFHEISSVPSRPCEQRVVQLSTVSHDDASDSDSLYSHETWDSKQSGNGQ